MINKTKFILKSKLPIILASRSDSRKKILSDTGLEFEQIVSGVNEEDVKKKFKIKSYTFLAKKLAEEKALFVSKMKKNAYVIGADQICVKKNKVFNKPNFKKNALKQLSMLNSKTHKQISAVCITYNEKIIWSYVETAKMKMKNLSTAVLKSYIDKDMPLKSCGSYKFEDNGKYLFSEVDGNTNTILGLPILPLLNVLHKKKNNYLCIN